MIDKEYLISDFKCVATSLDAKEAMSLRTLMDQIKLKDAEHF